MKAADVVEVLGIGTPGFFGLARRATEAAVLVGQKAAQDLLEEARPLAPARHNSLVRRS
jgi:hypothetical protein